MTDQRKDEARALSKDELELSDMVRYPKLKSLEDAELSDVISRLRDRRDRARQIASRQRREMRGKAAPAGAGPAAGDTGTQSKAHFLAAALRRAQEEIKRREAPEGDQAALSRKALKMKQDNPPQPSPFPVEDRSADEGMQPIENEGIAPSGAFDDVGDKPVLERSRKVR